MRGAPGPARQFGFGIGIIPAYAGSTPTSSIELHFFEDHPRVCGEHVVHATPWGPHRGSSPRMRGAHDRFEEVSDFFRIIPAYAGSTLAGRAIKCCVRDHPRVCGEHLG